MVNNHPTLRLRSFSECLLKKQRDRVIITNGPVYSLAKVKESISIDTLFVLNDKANEDMSNEFFPELQDEELIPYILSLTPEDRTSSERCKTVINKVVDCDAYSMRWNRLTKARWEHAAPMYLKFGFIENNPKLLVISIHPSRYK